MKQSLLWLLDNLRIRQLADCQLMDGTSRRLDNSQTEQLADATDDFECLVFVFLPFTDVSSDDLKKLQSALVASYDLWPGNGESRILTTGLNIG